PPANQRPLPGVSATGGPSTAVTRMDPPRPSLSHRWPHFLKDGEHFLYLVMAGGPRPLSELYVGSIHSQETRMLLTDASNATAVPGYLLFVRDRTLLAQPFDAERLEVTGEARPLAEGVHRHRHRRNASFSASEHALAYQPDGVSSYRLAWLNRTGREIGTVGDPGDYAGLRISP